MNKKQHHIATSLPQSHKWWLRAIVLLMATICINHPLLAQDTAKVERTDLVELYRKRFKGGGDMPSYETNKLKVAIIPAAATDGGSFCFVTPIVTTFRLGDESTTRLSQIYFTPYFTFSNQWVFPIRTYIYAPNNKFTFSGDYRFMIYPQKTFELGVQQMSGVQSIIHYKQYRFYQTTSVKILKNTFVGMGVMYDHYFNIWEEPEPLHPDSSDYLKYMGIPTEKYTSSALALEFKIDKRSHEMNPQKGMFFNNIVRFNGQWMGSTDNWGSLFTEYRKYISLQRQKERVMAFWGYYWTTLYGKPHYLDLPSIGWDRFGYSGRGIQKNRYRSNALLYFEGEYRTNITKNGLLGAVVFANFTAPSELNTQNFKKFYPAAGTGLRIKWDKVRLTNLALDMAFSKYYWTWYLGIAERF